MSNKFGRGSQIEINSLHITKSCNFQRLECNFHEPWAPKPQEGGNIGDVAFSLRCNQRGVNMVWQENRIIDNQHRFK